MNELVTYKGIIHFDPVNFTKKQTDQSSWKRVAMVMFDGEMTEYYAWFIKKRYDLVLNKPLRGAHVTFINDSLNDMKAGLQTEDEEYLELVWIVLGQVVYTCLHRLLHTKRLQIVICGFAKRLSHSLLEIFSVLDRDGLATRQVVVS